MHKLKDEMARAKTLVAQSRAACANEVRKRDRQIDALKKAVVDAGRVRGAATRGRDIVSITVVGETGGEAGNGSAVPPGGTAAEGYSLRMETNDFLTELAKGLSEENSVLLNLLRRTVDGLREMGGLERAAEEEEGEDAADGPRGTTAPQTQGADEMTDELEGIMEHLRTILTNPSFVPIEEVEVRETEITRLREGWERMEARWKDAVRMMDGWRRRMASNGKPVDMEELQMGIRLSPVRVRDGPPSDEPDMSREPELRERELYRQELSCVQEEDEEEEDEDDLIDEEDELDAEMDEEEEVHQVEPPKSPELAESLNLVPARNYEIEEDDDESEQSSLFQENVDMDELEDEGPNVEILQTSTATTVESPPLPGPPQFSPLKDSRTSGNRGSHGNSGNSRKRPGDFTTNVEEKARELAAADDVPPPPPPHAAKPSSAQKHLKPTPDGQDPIRFVSTISRDSTLFGESYESPIRSNPTRKLFSKPSPASSQEAPQRTPNEVQSGPVAKVRKTKKADDIASAAAASPDLKPVASTRKTRSASKRIVSAPILPSHKTSAASSAASAEKSTASRQAVNSIASNKSSNTSGASRNASQASPRRTPSVSTRLSTVRKQPAVQQSPITMATIAAKLAASEREADAARVRAKLRAARMSRSRATGSPAVTAPTPTRVPSGAPVAVSPLPDTSVDPVKKDVSPLPPRLPSSHPASAVPSPAPVPVPVPTPRAASKTQETHDDDDEDELVYTGRSPTNSAAGTPQRQLRRARAPVPERNSSRPEKRKRDPRKPANKAATRRRSTLSPWELESLIQGNVEVESPAK